MHGFDANQFVEHKSLGHNDDDDNMIRAAASRLVRVAPTHRSLARTYVNPPRLLFQQTTRRMLSKSTTSITRSHVRGIGYSTVPKLLFSLVRVPAIIGATCTAGIVYVQYKVEEGTRYTKDLFASGADWANELWESTKDVVESRTDFELPEFKVPQWLQQILRIEETQNGYEKKRSDNEKPEPSRPELPAVLAAAAVSLSSEDESPTKTRATQTRLAKDDQMMVLTRKMIEIRNLLKQIDKTEALTLPSIVVIGSQSSGKSSVLESIVGHEFLPKGSNMVTRRPIELTLVNTPGASAEYGIFPALGNSKITDFQQIQSTLTTMNKAVTDEECVSDDPIQLNIYSPNVPDLTLIDLPGYIQIQSKNQPANLKHKIADLCEQYIKEPNIILAVCAADVDLANSPALRASRRVDPLGIRTLGVVTKMDLVTPDRGASILKDSNYPLSLGYIGVICRATPVASGGLFSRAENIFEAMTRNETNFFGAAPQYAPATGCKVGTSTLRHSLMNVLEQSMSASLQTTADAIRMELEEAVYQFKVQYNDRSLTSETYVAETIDQFKHGFKSFAERFGKQQVRNILKEKLDQDGVMELIAKHYWRDLNIEDWASNPVSDTHWQRKLDATQSALTRMGIGRLSTTLVSEELIARMNELVLAGPLRAHPFAREQIDHAIRDILNARFHGTAEQVENCIKPYKFEVDVERDEWSAARQRAVALLEQEAAYIQTQYKKLVNDFGSRTLNRVIEYNKTKHETKESVGYSQTLIQKGRDAEYLQKMQKIVDARRIFLKSRSCASTDARYICPEIFLNAVAQKLTNTAVLFINVELLSEFFYQFPRELDARLVRNLTPEQIDLFAKEDSKIRAHIELQQKKELLELALHKMEGIMLLEAENPRWT